MTAKHETYHVIHLGTATPQKLRELQAKHRSLQTRSVGRDVMQIRFNDADTWMTPEEWAANYEASEMKRLHDLVSAQSSVFPTRKLVLAMPETFSTSLLEEFEKVILDKNGWVASQDYQSLKDAFDKDEELISQYQQYYPEARQKARDLEAELKNVLSAKENYSTTVISGLQTLIQEAKFGSVKVSALEDLLREIQS